jgi:AcrR family transcriptional regulator
MSEAPGLRDRKKQRTRLTIERVALDLFERRGFAATTIEDVAAAADIAPRTFFHYFTSKEEVVTADYTSRLQQIVGALESRSADQQPWSALRSAFMNAATNYETERDHLLRRFRIIQANPSVAAHNLQVQAQWEDAVADAVVGWLDVDGATDIRPRLIAGAALAALRASLRIWLADDGNSRLPDHLADAFDLLDHGLGAIVERP